MASSAQSPVSLPAVGLRALGRGRINLGTKLSAVVCACTIVMTAAAAGFVMHRFQTEADAKAQTLAVQATGNIDARVQAEFKTSFEIVTSTADSLGALWTGNSRDRRVAGLLVKHMLEADPDRWRATWRRKACRSRRAGGREIKKRAPRNRPVSHARL